MTRRFVALAAALALMLLPLRAQLGKQQGLLDPNVAAEKDLAAVPGLTPDIVKGILANRPFADITALNTFLLGQKLTQDKIGELYKKIFIHVNLNTGTREEILLIPGAGNRMVREFGEYRPWLSYAQFQKEIGKYVDATEVARLAQYTFIPINLNTASDEDILSIPGAGARMVREFKEYRPWKTSEQFHKEIGKYVNPKEVARLERYVVIK